MRAAAWLAVLAGLLWLFHGTGCMERMFYLPTRGPTPLSAAPPGAEGVWFESADGTRLYGWFIPAAAPGGDDSAPQADGESARRGTVLHVHGNAGNIQFHTFFTEHLPPAGFNVFIFDFRGYGQSEGAARRRDELIRDTHAALDALLARPDVDPRRIGLYGQSLGASIAINVMAERPADEIAAAVFESPFDSWRGIAANALGGDPPNPVARFFAGLVIPDHARPLDAIGRIERPMLIIHGDADTIVPMSHSKRLADAAGDHAELVLLPDGDHNTLRSTHAEVDRLMIEFFRQHLVPD